MTAEELFESIGALDEELIGNTEKILRKVKSRGIITKITSCAAASVALMVLPFAILALTPAGSAAPNNTGGGAQTAAPNTSSKDQSPVKPIWMYEINGLYYEVCENTDVLSAYGIEYSADMSMAGEYIGEFDYGSSYSVAKVYRLKDNETEELLLAEIEGDLYYLVSWEGNQ